MCAGQAPAGGLARCRVWGSRKLQSVWLRLKAEPGPEPPSGMGRPPLHLWGLSVSTCKTRGLGQIPCWGTLLRCDSLHSCSSKNLEGSPALGGDQTHLPLTRWERGSSRVTTQLSSPEAASCPPTMCTCAGPETLRGRVGQAEGQCLEHKPLGCPDPSSNSGLPLELGDLEPVAPPL